MRKPFQSFRRLRHETLEDRRLLATDLAQIAGVVSNDLNGDGTGTAFAAGVSVELFLDDGDNTFDSGDTSQGTDISDANGAYNFDNLEAGSYFVKITPPAGQQTRTNGDVSSLITFTAGEAAGSTNLTIDDFSTTQSVNAASGGSAVDTSADGANADSGGVRDMRVALTAGIGQIDLVSDFVSTGFLNLSSTGNVNGIANVVWDGSDGSASTVDASGLSLDLSNGGVNSALLIDAAADRTDSNVTIRLYSGAGNISEATVEILDDDAGIDGDAAESISIPFTSFNVISGTGVNFSNVGAIEVELDFQDVATQSGYDAQIDVVGVVGFTTKSADFIVLNEMSLGDQVWIDLDNDGMFEAGEVGVAGVAVTLYEDTDGDDDYTDETPLQTALTDASGNYLFEGLFPSDYIVQIDEANFDAGGALEGVVTSTGNDTGGMAPDPDTADDNDKDKGTLQGDGSVVSKGVTLIGNTEPVNDGDTDNNTNRTLDFGFFGFDVVIDKQVNLATAAPDDTLIYTVVVTNDGPSTATDVDLTDTLPTGVTFVSGTTTVAGQSVSGNAGSQTVTSTIGTLLNGQSATITINATINAAATGTLINAAVTSATDESNVNNNSDTAQTVIQPEIDLTITKVDNDNNLSLLPGDTIQYTLGVTNNGPSGATGVTVTDLLPTGLTFDATGSTAPASSAAVAGGTQLTYNLGALGSGATLGTPITINAIIGANFSGTLTNTASVTGNETETNEQNNSASASSVVVPPQIDLAITKVDNDNNLTLAPSDSIAYTLNARNNGPSDATGVTVVDVLPTGLTFNATGSTAPTSTVAVAGGTQLTYSLGSLANGASTNITINADISSTFTGTLTNTAAISGNETETTTVNNNASAQSVVAITPATISGKVYFDADNDGLFDSSEQPISGVLLTLTGTDLNGATVLQTTTTDASGCYEFTNLNPGTYQVRETQPTFFTDGQDTATFPGATAGADVISTITVGAGDNAPANNFGELAPTLSKRRFLASQVG